MATYQILFWHDIPVQVKAHDDEGRVNQPLPERFSAAVDSAAMASGITEAGVYADGYHWTEQRTRHGSAEQVVAEVTAELDSAYPMIDWQRTAANLRAGNGA